MQLHVCVYYRYPKPKGDVHYEQKLLSYDDCNTKFGGRLHAIIPPQQIGRIMSNIELARIDENNFIQVFDLKLAESKSNLFQIQSGVQHKYMYIISNAFLLEYSMMIQWLVT